VRLTQPVYAIRNPARPYPDLRLMRYATPRDLDQLVPACAAMHLEEVGIDPMQRDGAAYRKRIKELVAARRALVRVIDGRIAFKCEYSAVTASAIQLMGVWTAPEFRNQGMARASLEEVCGHVLHQEKSITLFVNDFNTVAIHLYESLGFTRIGANRALIW
jgi:predicted GNAT family acetyltransferase